MDVVDSVAGTVPSRSSKSSRSIEGSAEGNAGSVELELGSEK